MSSVLDEIRHRQEGEREARLRYLEQRVVELERHRDVLAVFLFGAWICLTVVAVFWEYRR